MTAWLAKISSDKAQVSAADMEQIKHLSQNFQELIKNKAECSEVQLLATQKTNKQDTEQCMEALEVLHRMIENLCVLIVEMAKKDQNSQ